MNHIIVNIFFILSCVCGKAQHHVKKKRCYSQDQQQIAEILANFQHLPKWWIDCQNQCNICNCKGITCDAQNGSHMTSIDMRSTGIKGSFPHDSRISWPSQLSKLYLSKNEINGTFDLC